MRIIVNNHETLTLAVGGAELTVGTAELFKAWLDKHIIKPVQNLLEIPKQQAGEKFGGSYITPDGKMCSFFLLPGDNDDANWQAQMDWAKSIGGDLPNKIEGAMLVACNKAEFKGCAYWLNEQHAAYSNYAWCQDFYNGYQYYLIKSLKLRARAVRRVFSDLVIQ